MVFFILINLIQESSQESSEPRRRTDGKRDLISVSPSLARDVWSRLSLLTTNFTASIPLCRDPAQLLSASHKITITEEDDNIRLKHNCFVGGTVHEGRSVNGSIMAAIMVSLCVHQLGVTGDVSYSETLPAFWPGLPYLSEEQLWFI